MIKRDANVLDSRTFFFSLFPVASTWFLPAGSHTLMPPPAHQLQTSLAAAGLSCDRLGLRDHRYTPYTHHFPRRSPPHGECESTFSAESRDYVIRTRPPLPKSRDNEFLHTVIMLSHIEHRPMTSFFIAFSAPLTLFYCKKYSREKAVFMETWKLFHWIYN